jgi:signal transduction histidine kinase
VLGIAEGIGLNLGQTFEYLSHINSRHFDLYVDLTGIFRERQELSRRLLNEDRFKGMLESLAHYINNTIMNISGQCEILQLLHQNGDKDEIFEKIPSLNETIRLSANRISTVLRELSSITGMEKIGSLMYPGALDIERSLKEKLEENPVEI